MKSSICLLGFPASVHMYKNLSFSAEKIDAGLSILDLTAKNAGNQRGAAKITCFPEWTTIWQIKMKDIIEVYTW